MPEETQVHQHPDHNDEHPACPDHYHRCYGHANFHIDCPMPHEHMPKMKTELLNVPCGAANPHSQITAFLGQPDHEHTQIVQVVDLGHDGWLVIALTPE